MGVNPLLQPPLGLNRSPESTTEEARSSPEHKYYLPNRHSPSTTSDHNTDDIQIANSSDEEK